MAPVAEPITAHTRGQEVTPRTEASRSSDRDIKTNRSVSEKDPDDSKSQQAAPAPESAGKQKETGSKSEEAPKEQSKDSLDTQFTTGALPAGFERHGTPEGRWYFVDHNTRTTSWSHPILGYPMRSKGTDPTLPAHVETSTDKKGRAYYIDHSTKTTSWMHLARVKEMREKEIPCEMFTTENGTKYWVDYEAETVHDHNPHPLCKEKSRL